MIEPTAGRAVRGFVLAAMLMVVGAVGATVPPPPGLDPALVRTASPARPEAVLPVDAVLAPFRRMAPPRAPRTELDAQTRDEALFEYLGGREAALDGQWLLAATRLESARALDPGSPEILRELARVYDALRNPGRGLQAMRDLLAVDPDDDEARLVLALDAVNRREMKRAIELLAPNEGDPDAWSHDPAARLLADFALHVALMELRYDRAAIAVGRRVVTEIAFPIDGGTRYRPRLASVFRQRGAIWQALGDAHARLGELDEALAAYVEATRMPIADPDMLRARLMWVNLELGRPDVAQALLVERLESTAPALSEEAIRLCGYLAENVPAPDAARAAVRTLSATYPEAVPVARAAALLLPEREAGDVLRGFVQQRPRDLGPVRQLMAALGEGQPRAAVALAASLAAGQPDLADTYANALMRGLPDPVAVLDLATPTAVPDDPAEAAIRVRVFLGRSGIGAAWQALTAALERWPADAALRRLRILVAGRLDEPPWLDEAYRMAEPDDLESNLLAVAAWRGLGDVGAARAALETASRLATRDEDRARVAIERGLIAIEEASRTVGPPRREALLAAAEHLEAAWRLVPTNELAPTRLLELYAGRESLFDAERVRETMTELRRTQPDGGLVARLVAEEAIRRGRFQLAVERMVALADERPEDPQFFSIALVAWDGLGRAEDAERWLRGRLAAHPGDPMALDQLVRLLVSEERTADAMRVLEDRPSGGVDPAVQRLTEMVLSADGDHVGALALGRARLGRRPAGTRRALQLAVLLAAAGETDEAATELASIGARATRATPRHLEAAISLSTRLGDGDPLPRPRLTIDLVEAATLRYPDRSLPVYGAGLRALAQLDAEPARFDALARQASRAALGAGAAEVEGVLPWRDLAQRLCDDGHVAAAGRALRARLETAIGLDEQAVSLLASMILIADAAEGDAASSMDLLLRLEVEGRLPALPGMQGAPTLAATLMEASQVYTLLGDDPGAEVMLRGAIRRDVADPMAKNNLGYMLVDLGRRDDDVIRWVEEAGAALPEDPSVLDTVGWLRYKQGIFDGADGAVAYLERALQLDTDPSPEVLDHMGDAYWRQGRIDDALRMWRAAVDALSDPAFEGRMRRNLQLLQTQLWGLLVRDPDGMYDQQFGKMRRRVQAKLDAERAGGTPVVAPTFDEHEAAPDSPDATEVR